MKNRFIALILALILALSLCACAENGVADVQETQEPSEIPTKVRVEDFYRSSGSYTDGVGNTYNYSYALPLICGVDTDDAAAANGAIKDIFQNDIQSELDAMQEGISLTVCNVGYEYVCFKGVTSVLISVDTDWGSSFYYCFNFDADGRALSNSGLLELKGVSEDDFLKAAGELLGESAQLKDIPEDMSEEAQKVRERTLSAENCNMEMPMYLDASGRLCFVGRVYSLAGADSYLYLFCTEK